MRVLIVLALLVAGFSAYASELMPLNQGNERRDYTELASFELNLPIGNSGWVYTLGETQDPTALSFWYTRSLLCRNLRTNNVFVRYKDPIITDPDYNPAWTRLMPTTVRGITKYMTEIEFNQASFYINSDWPARCVIRLLSSDPAEADFFETIIEVRSLTCDSYKAGTENCIAEVERLDQDSSLTYEVDHDDVVTFGLRQGRVYRAEAYVATLTDRLVMRILSASLLELK